MKKLTILAISFLILSCNTVQRVEKRRYMKGYHVQLSQKTNTPSKFKNRKPDGQKTSSIAIDRNESTAKEVQEMRKDRFWRKVKEEEATSDAQAQTSSNSKDIISPPPREISSQNEISRKKSSGVDTQKKKDGDGLIALFGGLTAMLIAGAFTSNVASVRKISYWAQDHKWKTKGLITGIKVILGLGGLFTGRMLFDMDFSISESARNVLLSVFSATALLYPVKNTSNKLFKHSYLRQKMHDLLLAMSGFLLIITLGNQAAADKDLVAPVTAMYEVVDNTFGNTNSGTQLKTGQQQELSNQENFVHPKSINGGNVALNILLTILCLALFLALEFLVLALACGIACNGQEFVAAVVAIGGTVGLIALLISVLKKVWED